MYTWFNVSTMFVFEARILRRRRGVSAAYVEVGDVVNLQSSFKPCQQTAVYSSSSSIHLNYVYVTANSYGSKLLVAVIVVSVVCL